MVAAVALVPLSVFTLGHQFEITVLNTIRAAPLVSGPKRWGKAHLWESLAEAENEQMLASTCKRGRV
jgi:hypothetical protein